MSSNRGSFAQRPVMLLLGEDITMATSAEKARVASAVAVVVPLLLFGTGIVPAHADPSCGGQAIIGGVPSDPALCLLLPPPAPYLGPEPIPGELTLGPEIDDHLVGAAEDAKGDLPLPGWAYLDPEQIPLVLMPPQVEHDPEVCDPNYGCGHPQPPH
jgi:hypothetical protein